MNSSMTIVLCCAMFCHGCVTDMRSFKWLSGTWEMSKPNGSLRLETWEVKDAKTLTGKGLKVVGGDTILLEHISLYYDQGDVWYAPVVPDQNNGQTVLFKLVSLKINQYTFENPAHDFPQRIVYSFTPINQEEPFVASLGDTLNVAVTALNGEGIHFRFTRKQLK